MEVIGGSGFWGTSKPYCSFCGWNLQLAKEIERESLRQFPRNLLLFAGFFAFVGYLSKSGFAFFPFLFLSVFVVGRAIVSWRKLKLLEVSHPAVAYANTLPLAMAAKENIKTTPVNTHLYLSALSKPRMVRFKPVARVITIAFPISWIFILYFGYQIVRDEISVSGPLATLRDLAPPPTVRSDLVGHRNNNNSQCPERSKAIGRRRRRHGHRYSPRAYPRETSEKPNPI